ncbi:MerR family transcriptional regulator [Streptomyces sp. NPDC058486]|uniref:MerR family transcriptional regulator n=1 Tax=unclassified Streptomyces TaxID=2593676 RepID=UPI003653EA44
MRFIGELRGLGPAVAEIRELTTGHLNGPGGPVGYHLTERLHRSRERAAGGPLWGSIAAQQQILAPIQQFEVEHQQQLTVGELCRAGDPRGCDIRA